MNRASSRVRRAGVCALMAGCLAGCASVEARSSNVSWTRAGADSETVRLEYGFCGGDFSPIGAMVFSPENFADIDACMAAKGFARSW